MYFERQTVDEISKEIHESSTGSEVIFPIDMLLQHQKDAQ